MLVTCEGVVPGGRHRGSVLDTECMGEFIMLKASTFTICAFFCVYDFNI